MTADLVAFLRDRLDDTARKAEEAAKHCAALVAAAASREGVWKPPYVGAEWSSDADHVYAHDSRPDQPRAEIADFGYSAFMLTPHIQEHGPARVLAEVDAKRRMLDEYALALTQRNDLAGTPHALTGSVRLLTALRFVKMLALPHREHPDYQPEWAPEA